MKILLAADKPAGRLFDAVGEKLGVSLGGFGRGARRNAGLLDFIEPDGQSGVTNG